ncbi:MAG: peptide ABC transporter substrate-binding protein [SAR202 cluster bacterium]|nr:peptide ABC transporter substrate-binding protein [SAR202 cluster bacterium]
MIKCFVKFLKLFLITTILLLTLSCNSLVGEGTSKESDIDLDKDSTQVTENITKSNNEESIKNLNSNKDSSTDNDSQIKSNSKDKESTDTNSKTGGVLRRLWSDPPTLDPHLSSDTTSSGIVVEIHSGLITLNPQLEIIPDIAESWEVSDDLLTYTFIIRDDAVFHDGKKITANDFKWSFERAANPKTASPVADTYLSDIVGVNEVIDGIRNDISGVKIIDNLTLEITIDEPKPYFLAKLTYPTAYVLDKENVLNGGSNWADKPNGAGPFKLKEYKVGERLILERNQNYHLGSPKLNRIVMNLAGGQSMAMYENDEIDITGVGMLDLERVLDLNNPLSTEIVVAPPSFSITYIGFNTNVNPFDDIYFRKALTHSINKPLIASEVLSDLVIPAYGILPPGFPGYQKDLKGLEYNLEIAREYLAKSKYSDPSTRDRIVITVPGSGGNIGIDLEVILNMWSEELGIEVEIQQVEWATYLEDLQKQKFQAFGGLGWEADYPDPQDFLDILFHTESELNHGGYSNDVIDSLIVEARTEVDSNKRIEIYHDIEQRLVNDSPWIPLWFAGERYVLIKPYIKNYFLTPMVIPKLRYVYIDKTE